MLPFSSISHHALILVSNNDPLYFFICVWLVVLLGLWLCSSQAGRLLLLLISSLCVCLSLLPLCVDVLFDMCTYVDR